MNKTTSGGIAIVALLLFLASGAEFLISDIGKTPLREFVWTGEALGHVLGGLATALGVAFGVRGFAVAHKREVTGAHSRETLTGRKKGQ